MLLPPRTTWASTNHCPWTWIAYIAQWVRAPQITLDHGWASPFGEMLSCPVASGSGLLVHWSLGSRHAHCRRASCSQTSATILAHAARMWPLICGMTMLDRPSIG